MSTMNEKVPVKTALSDIYPPDALLQQGERWDKLATRFISVYGRSPDFVARSPGRVAIIGEHIDYSLYPVMPMSIQADVVIAVATTPATGPSATVRIKNLDDEKYKPHEFSQSITEQIAIDTSNYAWTNYFKAGMTGALPMLQREEPGIELKDLDLLVHGTVPAGGGVSSSAAFVSTSALAVSFAHGHLPVKKELTELAIVSERAVGVNSGGMDQAASILSIQGDALFVEFYPSLNAVAVPFPSMSYHHMTFLIAQSFVVSNKAETGPIHYNLRVVECTLAAVFIAAKLGLQPLPQDHSPLGYSLRGLEDALFNSDKAPTDQDYSKAEYRLDHMLALVDTFLPDEKGYTREDIASAIGIPVSEIETRYTTKIPVRATRFKLRQRARHVFSEARRVHAFVQLMRSKVTPTAEGEEDILRRLGALMNETQESCRAQYECSCHEIDELCSIARQAGSYGSRLTGAGWGGCSVHLVSKEKVDNVKQAWESQFYSKRGISGDQLKDAIVVSEPGNGAMIMQLNT